jgi:hypothetical protein
VLAALLAGAYALQLSGRLEGAFLFAAVAIAQPIYLITALGIAHDARRAVRAMTDRADVGSAR